VFIQLVHTWANVVDSASKFYQTVFKLKSFTLHVLQTNSSKGASSD